MKSSNHTTLLSLLQLVSPALPVGAYSYSEGLETLVEQLIITDQKTLENWIIQELFFGSIRIEAAIMLRSYQSIIDNDLETLIAWNSWLSAARETRELRQQSWQMGQSLLKLLLDLEPQIQSVISVIKSPCNYAVAFGIAGAYWHIKSQVIIIGYLQSWTTNLISAGVRLIPLGQTSGQKLLINLYPILIQSTQEIFSLKDSELNSCNWGLSLASMAHESQYTRLFRS